MVIGIWFIIDYFQYFGINCVGNRGNQGKVEIFVVMGVKLGFVGIGLFDNVFNSGKGCIGCWVFNFLLMVMFQDQSIYILIFQIQSSYGIIVFIFYYNGFVIGFCFRVMGMNFFGCYGVCLSYCYRCKYSKGY